MAMGDSLIPQPRQAGNERREAEEAARRAERRDGANRNSNSTVPTGSVLELQGGINIPGGYINVREGGDISAIANGTDRYTGNDITVTTSLGNREVLDAWTGISVLRPGIWLSSSSNPADPANLASITSRYGDNVEIRSLTFDDGVGGRWRSRTNVDPAGASIGWSREEGDPASPSTGGTSHSGGMSVSIDSALFLEAFNRNGPADNPTTVSTYNALSMRPWGGQMGPPDGLKIRYERYDYNGTYLDKGLFKFDKDGVMTLHSEKGSNTVDVTHNGDGVLTLAGSAGVNVSGSFTVNGAPVGGAVSSVNGKTGAVVLVKGDLGLDNVDNTADLAKPVSTAQQTALDAKAPAVAARAIPLGGNTQAIANAAWTQIVFQSNQTPPVGTTVSLGAGTVTVTDAGMYALTAVAGTSATNSGAVGLRIRNGSNILATALYDASPAGTSINVATEDFCAAGDVLAIDYYQSSGATRNTTASRFTVRKSSN